MKSTLSKMIIILIN